MIALYHEHKKGIELLVSVHDGDEVARIAVGEHLRRSGEEGREGGRREHVSSGYRLYSSPVSFYIQNATTRERVHSH